MAKLGLCPRCAGKWIYSNWTHARNDARSLNRKKRNTGHLAPYTCPAGKIHVGRCTGHQQKRAAR